MLLIVFTCSYDKKGNINVILSLHRFLFLYLNTLYILKNYGDCIGRVSNPIVFIEIMIFRRHQTHR